VISFEIELYNSSTIVYYATINEPNTTSHRYWEPLKFGEYARAARSERVAIMIRSYGHSGASGGAGVRDFADEIAMVPNLRAGCLLVVFFLSLR
jgi:hypothetical protein